MGGGYKSRISSEKFSSLQGLENTGSAVPTCMRFNNRKPHCGEELQQIAVQSWLQIATFLPLTTLLVFISNIHGTSFTPIYFLHKHLGNVDTSVSNATVKACDI